MAIDQPAQAGDRGIVVEALALEYEAGVRAVDAIDLDVQAGEIFGFLGPNGAGKSSTILMLTTLLPPSAGTAVVAGHDIRREGPAVRRAIGAALQEVALDPVLTGREHLRLQAALQGLPRRARLPRADELLERLGLADAADRRVGRYSGGMKRRLDLALALVHRPRVVFLDEPTAGLDPQSRADLWEELRRLAFVDGVTVFLTTHYLEEADVLADRVAIIDDGRIVAEGRPAELKAEIGRPSVEVTPGYPQDCERLQAVLERFGVPAAASSGRAAVQLERGLEALTDVVRTLDSEELRIRNIELHQPSLDDVFLSKTGRKLATEAPTRLVADSVVAP